ncbi:MAG: efflux RND transporter permease subunit [Fimbriimonadaceae bacterium]|nr:efflux RND transporter permease subunit [Fimbriimonadaceae bacterium]
MGLTRLAISRPVFFLMLMLLAIFGGLIAFTGMRKEQNPEVNFGTITVTSVYPGAGPEEVNTLVSRKIEEAMSGIEGILEVTSTSQEGISIVAAQFELGTNMDEALNDARAKVDATVPQLPRAVEKPTISKFDSASDPVLFLAFSSESMSSRQMRDLADDKLKDLFARIPGVASASVSGGQVREIQIQVKRDRLVAYKLGILDVVNAIQGATLNVPSGRSSTADREISVRVLGEYKTVEEIRDTSLSVKDPNAFGGKPTIVRLGDIAEVTDGSVERRNWRRLDGGDAVIMTIQKSKGGNAIEIDQGASKVIDTIATQYGIKTIKVQNQATIIAESLLDLNIALFFGIFLVTLIVYIFLHDWRGTLIVAIAIPLCLMAAFLAIKALGFTINNMTMLGLSLSVGILVDDAIVVLENIFRHLKMGEEPVEAAINGRNEIGLAAISITLADVVVFVPIAFMGGVVGQFFKPLAVTVVASVLLSLLVSFTVTPMLASRWYKKGEDVEHPKGGFARAFEAGFHKFEKFYRRLLESALNHRWEVFIGGFVALIGVFMLIAGSFAGSSLLAIQGAIPLFVISVLIGIVVFGINAIRGHAKVKQILGGFAFGGVFILAALAGHGWADWKKEALFKFAFAPPSDAGLVSAKITMAPGSSLKQTEAVVKRIEDAARKHPDTKYVLSNVGARSGDFVGNETGPGFAEVRVTLNDRSAMLDSIMFWKKHEGKLRSRSDNAVAADLLEEIKRIPGADVTISAQSGFGFGAPIQMGFASDDTDKLLSTVSKIKERLQQGAIAGVVSPDISSKPGKPELQAIPDRVRLADFGMSVADVANSMRVLYDGNNDTKFRVNGREYDIRVMMDIGDRNDPHAVGSVPIRFVQGNPIYLDQVASLNEGIGIDKIDRRNKEQEIRLTADLLPGYAAGSVQTQISKLIEDEKLVADGVRIKPLGQADVQARESLYLFTALFTGFVLVYMLLASLYNNMLYPFIIQLAQPQAMVGALLALLLTDKTLNIVGFIGIIALVGLVGKNAILLVDYTNTLRGRGKSRRDALLEAGPTRLRPIMMTSLALVLGMLPVALAIGRGSEFRETIGITIIGGISLSTILTLLIIPCSYTIVDDIFLALSGRKRRAGGDQFPPSDALNGGEGEQSNPSPEIG